MVQAIPLLAGSAGSKVVESLGKYWHVIAIGGLLIYIYFTRKREKNSEAVADQYLETQPMSDDERLMLKRIAGQLAHHLGVIYPWWNPASWTENDNEVYILLRDLTLAQTEHVAYLYNTAFTDNRNLYVDVTAYLDSDLLEQLPYF